MKKKSVAQNYIYNLLFQVLTVLAPLITTPYLSRVLGSEQIGIYGYTFSIVTYFIILGSLGVSMYGQREIAYNQKSKEKQSKIFWELNIIKLLSYLVCITLFVIFFCIKGKFHIYYMILILEILANLIDISWYFQGIENFQKTIIRNMIAKVVGIILIFLFVKTKDDLWIYFVVSSGTNLLGNATLWTYVPKYINLRVKNLQLKRHLKPMILLFIPQIAIQIYVVLDKTMLGLIVKDMSVVGYYDQAQKIIRALLLLVTALGTVMNSKIANLYSEKKYKEVKDYLLMSTKMVLIASIPCIFGVIAISDKFVPWYFGDGYLPVVKLMNANSLILLAIGLNNVTGVQYLIQIGKQNLFTNSVIIGALTNIVLNIIFINKFGAIGAVYSSVIVETVILLIHLFYIKDMLTIKDIIKNSLKYVIAGFIMFLGVKKLTSILAISILNTLIEVGIGGMIYIMIILIIRDQFFIGILNQLLDAVKSRLRGKKV